MSWTKIAKNIDGFVKQYISVLSGWFKDKWFIDGFFSGNGNVWNTTTKNANTFTSQYIYFNEDWFGTPWFEGGFFYGDMWSKVDNVANIWTKV